MKSTGGLIDKFIRSRGIFMFIRSSISSQISGYVDIAVSIGLVALGLSEWAATPLGAVAGGVVNCCLNYRFTFRVSGYSHRAVALKFFLVWMMSLALNTFGTAYLATVLEAWKFTDAIGFTFLGNYAVARLLISLLVSVGWNYPMQYKFVYRANFFDRYAIKMFDLMGLKGKEKKAEQEENK